MIQGVVLRIKKEMEHVVCFEQTERERENDDDDEFCCDATLAVVSSVIFDDRFILSNSNDVPGFTFFSNADGLYFSSLCLFFRAVNVG